MYSINKGLSETNTFDITSLWYVICIRLVNTRLEYPLLAWIFEWNTSTSIERKECTRKEKKNKDNIYFNIKYHSFGDTFEVSSVFIWLTWIHVLHHQFETWEVLIEILNELLPIDSMIKLYDPLLTKMPYRWSIFTSMWCTKYRINLIRSKTKIFCQC
jgi:hypothetical protein